MFGYFRVKVALAYSNGGCAFHFLFTFLLIGGPLQDSLVIDISTFCTFLRLSISSCNFESVPPFWAQKGVIWGKNDTCEICDKTALLSWEFSEHEFTVVRWRIHDIWTDGLIIYVDEETSIPYEIICIVVKYTFITFKQERSLSFYVSYIYRKHILFCEIWQLTDLVNLTDFISVTGAHQKGAGAYSKIYVSYLRNFFTTGVSNLFLIV